MTIILPQRMMMAAETRIQLEVVDTRVKRVRSIGSNATSVRRDHRRIRLVGVRGQL